MANGWAPDGAVQEQIEDSVKDALASAQARMPSGDGLTECEECGGNLCAASALAEHCISRGSYPWHRKRSGERAVR